MPRLLAILLSIALAAMATASALAHHGWRWTTGKNIELTGLVKTVKLGNPHGVLTVDADGEVWTVEVGQPWRNERAGLKDGDLVKDVEIRIIGQPSADIADRKVKAERFYLGSTEYNLYPNRD